MAQNAARDRTDDHEFRAEDINANAERTVASSVDSQTDQSDANTVHAIEGVVPEGVASPVHDQANAIAAAFATGTSETKHEEISVDLPGFSKPIQELAVHIEPTHEAKSDYFSAKAVQAELSESMPQALAALSCSSRVATSAWPCFASG